MRYNSEDQKASTLERAKLQRMEMAIRRAIIDLDDFADPEGEYRPTPEALASVVRELQQAIEDTPNA